MNLLSIILEIGGGKMEYKIVNFLEVVRKSYVKLMIFRLGVEG